MLAIRPFVCTCLALVVCVPASAQTIQPTRPERPYRGIFASGIDNGGQSLTANTSLSAGYDDDILADATGSNSHKGDQQGALTQFSGGLNYGLAGARGAFNAGAGTSIRYYPSLEEPLFKTYNASIGGQVLVLRSPNLTVYSSANYQPYTFLSGLSASGVDTGLEVQGAPPEPDFVPIATQYVSYQGGANLDVPLTRRTSVVSSYSYRVSDQNSYYFWRQSGSMGLKFGLTRDVSVRTEYRYTEAHYPSETVRSHSPNVGLDFNHALSLTRRTSLTFGVGTQATASSETTHYRVTGNVEVTHEIGRTWTAQGSYQRGTNFIDTLTEPVFADGVRATLSGLLTRRLQFQALAAATFGKTGFTTQRRSDSYRASVSLSTALNRYMNVGVNYAYYTYFFDPEVQLQPGVPNNSNRQSIRGHVSFWAPLLNRTRRRDASR